jgi:hypothetical protein
MKFFPQLFLNLGKKSGQICSKTEEETFLIVTHSEGKEALETALRYIEQQKESTTGDVMLIKKWRYYAASKKRSSLQQRKVIEFFK